MKGFLIKVCVMSVLAVFAVSMSGVHEAEAKRFGGGMSFGQQRMAPSKPNSFSQRQAIPAKQPAAAGKAASPARGGFMGAIAGLALGGLLGAMFFGGAFEGINFFDILLIGGIIFAVFWFLRRKAPVGMQQDQFAYAGQQHQEQAPYGQQPYGQQDLFQQQELTGGAAAAAAEPAPHIDAAFITQAAKDIFVRMQVSWDARDMNDIRSFCTAEVANYIEIQMREAGNKVSKTEVAMLDAHIVDVWAEKGMEWVGVHFNAMLREQELDDNGVAVEDATHEVQEIWTFHHDPKSDDPTWYLAGIQQVK